MNLYNIYLGKDNKTTYIINNYQINKIQKKYKLRRKLYVGNHYFAKKEKKPKRQIRKPIKHHL